MVNALWLISLKRLLFSGLFIFVIGVIFDHFTSEKGRETPFSAGAIAIGAYLAASTVLWIVNAISEGIYMQAFADNDLTEACLTDLRRARLPPPTDWNSKNFNFLSELADDQGADANARVRAAVLFGGYKIVIDRSIIRGVALHRAIDKAVLRYAQEAPHLRSD